MKQLHVKTYYNILYGGTGHVGLLDGAAGGHYFTPASDGFVPLSIATTARNLSVLCPVPGHAAVTFAVQKRGSGSEIAVTIPAGVTTPVKNLVDQLTFAPGDCIRGRWTGVAQTFQAIRNMSVSVELEAAAGQYGIAAVQGAPTVGNGWKGGGLGNGVFSTFVPVVYTPGNTKSINAVAGTITSLCNFAFSGAPGAGIWTSYVIKNSILQNGAGGTVDTSCVMTGANFFAVSSFSLPVAIQDVIEILVLRSGINAPGSNVHVATSLALTPTIDGRFMFCGGSNSAMGGPIAYRWIESDQGITPEQYASAIVGPGGVTCHGMYIDQTQDPNPGSLVHTLRRSLTDTALVVNLTGTQRTGSDLTPDEVFPEDALINLASTRVSSGNIGQLHWSIPVSIVVPPPATGSLIVQKVTDPADSTQAFTFTTAGGLSPSTFALQNGGVQTFAGIAPGTYAVTETPVAGWTTTYGVSNDSPESAITVAANETVTVTVTNVEDTGNGGGNGGDEGDCPEQVAAGCWSPHDINRLTVNLDGDYDL